ncbi:MAG: hypothetical protein RLZZ617_932, partial [Bacteroidota bacterium]
MHPPQECVKIKPKNRQKMPKYGQNAHAKQVLGMHLQAIGLVQGDQGRYDSGDNMQGMHPRNHIEEGAGGVTHQKDPLLGQLQVG